MKRGEEGRGEDVKGSDRPILTMSISLTRMMIIELHFLTLSLIKEEGFH